MKPKTPFFLSRRQFIQAVGAASAALALRAEGAVSHGVFTAGTPFKNAAAEGARPLPLSAVRLTGGPLKHAQDMDAKYLLELEPDRMMAFLRIRAGLAPKAAGYGGWDGDGRNLTGHIAGHYLSAVSLMYAATGDGRFKQRADTLVAEMQAVQDKQGDGYIGALMDGSGVDGKARFAELGQGHVRSGGFDLNGLWSPWYVQHKLFAGLRDAYRFAHNPAALAVEKKFAGWAEGVVSGLNDAEDQQMLRTEFGGMNEVLADLYADTQDPRWLALSDRFEQRAVRDPLARREDILGGLHGNTQIPKLVGSLARYRYTGNKADGAAAAFFWDAVTTHHSFATGGHGKDEYFGPPDALSDRVDGRTDESCNVYNMLKLTRALFAVTPNIKYAEFQERALFNHVLGSIDPQDGRMCYMVPVGRGVQREYQDMFGSFTCCVGTGMENHALHGDGIYYEAGNRLWVNIYAPSRAEWKSAGAHLVMDTSFPEGSAATLTLSLAAPKKLTLALRRPAWAGEGFAVHVNGKALPALSHPGSYVEVTRVWKTGDQVTLTLPKSLRLEPLPDNPRRAALLWGPLVLAGDLGPEGTAPVGAASAPVFLTAEQPVGEWLKPVADAPGSFQAIGRNGAGGSGDIAVSLVPFYRLHRRTYAAYWDLYTPQEWAQKADAVAADQEKQRRLEAATVGFAQPGQMQAERDFNEQGEDSIPISAQEKGRAGRRSAKWFSFDMPVDPSHPMALIVTYHSGEQGHCAFDILADGRRVGAVAIDRPGPGSPAAHFFDSEYRLPPDLVKGKQKVTVRFQAAGGQEAATIYGIRTIRADAAR